MKIQQIEAIPLRIPFTVGGRSDAGAWGGKDLKTVDSLLLKVSTDAGLVGWGESFGFAAVPLVKAAIGISSAISATTERAVQSPGASKAQ